jgi:hypothetical protein
MTLPIDPSRPWAQHQLVPTISVRAALDKGLLDAYDHPTGVLVEGIDDEQLALWAGDRSRSDKHIALGDWIHAITTKLHIPHCAPCAARRSKLNRLMKR